MSKQVKKLFQGLLSGLASAGYKWVGTWIVQGSVIAWLAVQNTKINKIENPAKEFFHKTVIDDRIYPQIREKISECNTEGIFIGLFGVSDGVGKFLGLQGKWGVISSLTPEAQNAVRNPMLIKDPICRSIAINLNAVNEYLSFDNTKYKNDIYLEEFTSTSEPCKIDKELQQIMQNTFNHSQILRLAETNTTFVQCIMQQLKLPHFNSKLNAVYFYPITIRGLDYAFLTMSFTKAENGRCFSEDLSKQKKLFAEVAKIYQTIID
jgi:hypothetical protein